MEPKTQAELQAAGMHGSLPTVRIKADNEQGYAVINESDFDSKTMEKFEDAPKSARKARGE